MIEYVQECSLQDAQSIAQAGTQFYQVNCTVIISAILLIYLSILNYSHKVASTFSANF